MDELVKAGFTEHEIAVTRWVQNILTEDPTIDNRGLFTLTKDAGGDPGVVSKVRGLARSEFGITRHARGGTIDVAKFVAAAGPAAKWTEDRSLELRSLGGWKLINDPCAPPEPPKASKSLPGRRRKRTLVDALGAAVAAGEDEAFSFVITELRKQMKRLDIQSVTVDVGAVVVSRKVVLASRPEPELAPANGLGVEDAQ
jgi:hypothetical protein